MVKVFPVEEIRAIDRYIIEQEPISSIDLMERASNAFVDCLLDQNLIQKKDRIAIFCGQGNNGGDGLAIARILRSMHYQIEVYVLEISKQGSPDFERNLLRLGFPHKILNKENNEFSIRAEVIIDAIFGVGLSRPIEGFTAKVIQGLNKSESRRIAVDIPSGLFASENTTLRSDVVFKSDFTISFQFLKLAFLFPENDAFCGNCYTVDIGLSREYIEQSTCSEQVVLKADVKHILKKRNAYAHKGQHGRALIMAGSKGKIGAAILAARACLRSGIGLLSVHSPLRAEQSLHTACPEAMLELDKKLDQLSELKELDQYDCIGVGPGIGQENETQALVHQLIEYSPCPLVMDADALNIVSKDLSVLKTASKALILTPHVGEFERLVGQSANDFDRFNRLKEFAKEYDVYVILKGKNTAIACPEGNVFFNSSGNPGMATGGSGDVLTGVLTALVAQKYSIQEACIIGCFIHGMAGDIAAKQLGEISMLPSDLIECIPVAFEELRK